MHSNPWDLPSTHFLPSLVTFFHLTQLSISPHSLNLLQSLPSKNKLFYFITLSSIPPHYLPSHPTLFHPTPLFHPTLLSSISSHSLLSNHTLFHPTPVSSISSHSLPFHPTLFHSTPLSSTPLSSTPPHYLRSRPSLFHVTLVQTIWYLRNGVQLWCTCAMSRKSMGFIHHVSMIPQGPLRSTPWSPPLWSPTPLLLAIPLPAGHPLLVTHPFPFIWSPSPLHSVHPPLGTRFW